MKPTTLTTLTIKTPRPYWHVDAKWISGIVLLLLLSMTALIFLLWQITARSRGIDLLTTLLASSFSYQNGGLDDEGDVRLIRATIAAAPNKQWQPSAGLDIIVHEADIEGMTPRQVRLWFFRHIAEPLYDQGPQGLTGLVSDPAMQASIEQSARPLGFISARMHANLLWVLGGATLFSLLFLGLLVRFSQGPGSLSNPGAVLFLAGLPGALVWGVLRGWLGQACPARWCGACCAAGWDRQGRRWPNRRRKRRSNYTPNWQWTSYRPSSNKLYRSISS